MLSDYVLSRKKEWMQPHKLHSKWQNLNYVVAEEKQVPFGVIYWGPLAENDNPSFLAKAMRIPAQAFGQHSFKPTFIEYLSCTRYVQCAEGEEVNQKMQR